MAEQTPPPAISRETPQPAAAPAGSDSSTGSSSSTASHADLQKPHSTTQIDAQPTQQATPAQTDKQAGNVPSGSQAVPAGQVEANASLRSAASEMARKRWANQSAEPKDTRLGGNRQSSAHLDSPKSSGGNDLEPQGPRIGGLSDIPEAWPQLPGNVSLSQEIAWVQAERLRVVKEGARGGFKVDLSKARSPAPSMAALSWLETSIRSYAKFVEVASKQASSGQDEAEFVRKERLAIAEIRSILGEMMPKKD